MIVVDGVEMVDVREAARLASRNPETIRRWVWTGRLSAVKYGNKLLIRRDALVGESIVDPDAPSSLAEWASRARAVPRSRARMATASELVLEDRLRRSAGTADAGR